ncbi:MAG: hypothetical protein LBC51_11195 [Treponema sp.]|jgi:RNA polymerase sigma factor (sigma-70 family)|nr:hypothetical protein [Treponema sp.]
MPIAKNHCIDVLRTSKNTRLVPLDGIDDPYALTHTGQPHVLDRLIEQELLDTCRHILNSLKEPDKRLIFLKYYEGLNSKEIALIEGMPASTVRQRIMIIKAYSKERIGGAYAY